MSVRPAIMMAMGRCRRFRADGSACTNQTDYADGWCRETDCPGFQRSSQEAAPEAPEAAHRAADASARVVSRSVSLQGLALDDVEDLTITTRAMDSFRYHHGGGAPEAEVQLRAMLEDFILGSTRHGLSNGYVKLFREGFQLVLSPHLDAVVGYSTLHRERTWEQVKAGIASRISKRRPSQWASEFAPVPEQGPPIPLDRFARAMDPDSIYLTARVRRSFSKMENLPDEWDESLDGRIRLELVRFPKGKVAQRDDGMFEVSLQGRVWLVSEDVGHLVGVKRDPAVPEA